MMTAHTASRFLLIGAGLLAIPAAVAGLRSVEVEMEPEGNTVSEVTEVMGIGPLDSLVLVLAEHDPFRMARSPAAVAYSSAPVEATFLEPAPPKPQLALTGIMWGDEPSAILEGLPGVEGAQVLRAGESIGGIRTRRITRQDVTLVGMDTIWVLHVRKPW
jgi:hypothetical protein